MEDLWAFNDENVARAIYASQIPVISAVGHEPDVTIADFVADLRAATPSNAAELSVPDQNDLCHRLAGMEGAMAQSVGQTLTRAGTRLSAARENRLMQNPLRYLEERRVLLDYQRERMANTLRNTLGVERERFVRLAAALDAMSPLKVLGRGYAIARRPHGGIIRSKREVTPGETVSVMVADGAFTCEVTERPWRGEE